MNNREEDEFLLLDAFFIICDYPSPVSFLLPDKDRIYFLLWR